MHSSGLYLGKNTQMSPIYPVGKNTHLWDPRERQISIYERVAMYMHTYIL